MKEVFVTQSILPAMEDYTHELESIWEKKWLTNMGEKHEQFRCELEKYLCTQSLELVVNGHMALELSLQAMCPNGGEVITTPFTFASTTHAIVRSGLTPVFCDIDESNYTIDVNKLEALITSKTVAILPVHVYGNICNVEAIESIAKEHGLRVLYDAAHTFGETYNGVGVGNFGDASCFSFHATKVFNSIEGGCICYRDENIGKRIRQLRNFGIEDEENVGYVGTNSKMNEFCAAMGLCNLKIVDSEIEKRKSIAEKYIDRLSMVKGIGTNKVQQGVKSNYSYFPIIVNPKEYGHDRNYIYAKLLEKGIHSRKYFYPIISDFNCYREVFDSSKTPIAKKIGDRVLTLPLYGDLDSEVVDMICDVIEQR